MSNNQAEIEEGVFLKHVSALAEIDAKIEANNAERRKLRKQIRADGIPLSAMDDSIRFSGMDPSEARSYFAQLGTCLKHLKVPMGTQFDMFMESENDPTAEVDESTDNERIAGEQTALGFMAGVTGKPQSDCPHDHNSPMGQVWLQGHVDGLSSIGKKVKPKAKKSPVPDVKNKPGKIAADTEGEIAHDHGQPISACPYEINSARNSAWVRGYNAAKKKAGIAYDQGYKARENQETSDKNPHAEGTRLQKAWLSGYEQRQSEE